MATRKASARWTGTIGKGTGRVETESNALSADFSFGSRFESEAGTNPEELLGAAEAGCLAMAVSKALGEAGHEPRTVEVDAEVALGEHDGAPTVLGIDLTLRADAEGLDHDQLEQIAHDAQLACPVSRALSGTEITLRAAQLIV